LPGLFYGPGNAISRLGSRVAAGAAAAAVVFASLHELRCIVAAPCGAAVTIAFLVRLPRRGVALALGAGFGIPVTSVLRTIGARCIRVAGWAMFARAAFATMFTRAVLS